jgi:hypothetical protein
MVTESFDYIALTNISISTILLKLACSELSFSVFPQTLPLSSTLYCLHIDHNLTRLRIVQVALYRFSLVVLDILLSITVVNLFRLFAKWHAEVVNRLTSTWEEA